MKQELVKSEPKNEIVVYQPNETMRLEVRIENDTVWLNRQQMAKLFGRDVKTIGKHIANALKEELAPTVADNATVRVDGLSTRSRVQCPPDPVPAMLLADETPVASAG